MILEIDSLIDEVSIRRLHFYEGVGFKLNDYLHVHPAYRTAYHGHTLKVLSYKREINESTFNNFKQLNSIYVELP